jgi:outer membrane lipoprotein-sorting protein
MRKLAGWGALVAIVGIALAQGSGKDIVSAFVKAVNGAEALSVTYSAQTVGQGQREYSLEFAKPNKARIESASQLIVANGEEIYTLDKKANSYYKVHQTKDEFIALFDNQDLSVWWTFFDAKALDKMQSKGLGKRMMAGTEFQVVELTQDAAGRVVRTLFIDKENMLRRAQLVLKDQSGDESTVYMNRKSSTNSISPERFKFSPPEGSKEEDIEALRAAEWFTDLEEAKKVAAKTKRKIFIDFYADW